MTYGGAPIGPRWFQILLPGLVMVITTAMLILAELANPALLSQPTALVILGVSGFVSVALVGAAVVVGHRAGFRWKGWQEDEAKRQKAAQEATQQVMLRTLRALHKDDPQTLARLGIGGTRPESEDPDSGSASKRDKVGPGSEADDSDLAKDSDSSR